MSTKIVSVVNESETPSIDTGKQSGFTNDIGPLSISRSLNVGVKVDLVGGNHHMRHFYPPHKGLKCIKLFNPTPFCVKPILEEIKEPSLLWLRGCELLLQADHFPFEKFKTLTTLEISSINHLIKLPQKEISQMAQLQSLSLSHLPIEQLQHDFFSNLTLLRSFILEGCSNVRSLPEFPRLSTLESLHLSDLLIETLPEGFFANLERLRSLVLRGCSKLWFLPSIEPLRRLEMLDLSHCTSLQQWRSLRFFHPHLTKLDLSHTSLICMPFGIHVSNLTHVFLRDSKMFVHDMIEHAFKLKVLDLSGAQRVRFVDEFHKTKHLLALDLSRTCISSIDSISNLTSLTTLILKECARLVKLPPMKRLGKLEVLDISGCKILKDLPKDLCDLSNLKNLNLSRCSCLQELREGLFNQMSCLEKLDLSNTSFKHLPSLSNLYHLQTLNISHTLVEKVPGLSKLINLKELFLTNCPNLEMDPAFRTLANPRMEDLQGLADGYGNFKPTCLQGSISKPNEFHLVSTFISNSGFDRFKYKFTKLEDFLLNIQKDFKSSSSLEKIISPNTTANSDLNKHFRSIQADLKYILERIDLLESSCNRRSSEELLHKVMDFASHNSDDGLIDDASTTFNEIFRSVAKLKLLVPSPSNQVHELEEKEKYNKMKPMFRNSEDDEEDSDVEFDIPAPKMEDLVTSYESLSDMERNCLLYFAVVPYSDGFLKIKERVLIHLWYGEGYIDPQHEEDCALSMEEIGEQVLKALRDKGFIGRSKFCYMDSSVYLTVKKWAMEEGFFDFTHADGRVMLTPHVSSSRRACLLKAQGDIPSSCKLWTSYIGSSGKRQRLNMTRTLFNVNEPIIDIRSEWFSNMKDLVVLHLGRWDFDNEEEHTIDAVSFNFLEELKHMKQLRLLSLEGFTAIAKIPDSVCKLANLKVLNLRDCTYLEELPCGIGSLKRLTHLDLTNCHILSKLPKGFRLLSKLKVLKGFVINYQIGGRQHRKACTLVDLLNIERLTKLSLVVNMDTFPGANDLQVLKQMRKLCNLKITWEKNYNKDQDSSEALQCGTLRQSRLRRLTCWEQKVRRDEMKDTLRGNGFDNLRKLVLCCFPLETAPMWLGPVDLPKLEKLYIVGGNLKRLTQGAHQNAWNVKVLRFKYLPNLDMEWGELRNTFSNLRYFRKHKCHEIRNFPAYRDKWTIETESESGDQVEDL